MYVLTTIALACSDIAELLNKLAELQFSNRKLHEENSKLKQQLIVTEDTVNQHVTHITELQKAEKSWVE